MTVTAKKPAIRFEGFMEAWEQRKFGELYEKVSEKNDFTYGKEDIISVANMYYKPDSYITDPDYLKTYNVFHIGDIAFEGNKSKNFAHGRFVENTIGNGIVSHVFDVFRPKMEYDLLFWKYAINDERTMGNILVRSTKASTMMTNLVATDFLQESISVPSIDEQKRIGDFIDRLDNLITLHQRMYEKLVNIKITCLEKMFPKNGSNVPEIRFKGFSEAWEQHKLSECAGFRRGSFPQPYDKKEWYDGEEAMPFVQVADVSSDMKLVEDTKQKISKLAQSMSVFAEKESVLVTLQGSIGRVAITQYGAFIDRTVLIFDNYKDNIDKRFWAYIIKEKFEEEARRAPGGTIKTITKEALSDFDLLLPSYEEQRKLADYLLKLDKLITLRQLELEKLKHLKKAFLEKVFI